MEVSLKQALIAAAVVLALFAGLAIFWTIDKHAHEAQIVQLQNEVASRDKTIETQKGVYQKLTIQSNDLKGLLDQKDEQLKLLEAQLKKSGDDLLAASTLIVKLRKDLESDGHVVVQPPDPKYPGMTRVALDSKSDFDPFRVTGEVVTDCSLEQAQPPHASLRLSQTRAFRFSVIVSQSSDGTWKTSTTSSEENFQVDITLAAVNPHILEPRWYEKFGLGFDIGIGTNPGLLAGIGLYYQIGRFEVGPRAWVVVDRGVSPYFGAQMIWHPFQR